ncbi:MAG: endonuclease/exonuclease/phosphatase family protein [Dokdonella sp.]
MTCLRVATWNMHGGVGIDGRFAPERIVRVIGELDADVIALQEYGSRDVAFDMRAHIESAASAKAFVMPTFQKHGCDFGNVVLVRHEAIEVVGHLLDVDQREPRNAVEIVVAIGNVRLRVIACHLGLRAYERRQQIARLLELVRAKSNLPTVLFGDFNVWRRGTLGEIDRYFEMSAAPATFPSPFPLIALDRIWVTPASACVELCVHKSRAARIASDHLPLVATLDLS